MLRLEKQKQWARNCVQPPCVGLQIHAANIRVCAPNIEDEDGAQVCPLVVQRTDASRATVSEEKYFLPLSHSLKGMKKQNKTKASKSGVDKVRPESYIQSSMLNNAAHKHKGN